MISYNFEYWSKFLFIYYHSNIDYITTKILLKNKTILDTTNIDIL